MKVYKPKQYGFSIKSFGMQNKTYLTTTIPIFFDLSAPETILTEQELWSTLPDQLGKQTTPDMGFPKPRAEFLVTGSCFAIDEKAILASEVSVQVGEIQKKLLVYGDRDWNSAGIPTTPQPFVETPVDWQNSFGGDGYLNNPRGKGFHSSTSEGRERTPLPNIENPQQPMGSSSDKPEPVSFSPLELMWPQRFKYCGTYDGTWLEDRWPWFPDDFNPSFFNTAPADQCISGFFQGQEPIEIKNMHPVIPLIQSRLPGQRPRCFVTRKKELKPDAETEFIEVHHQIDTVWLFPTILRGVVFYRGTVEMLDDEFADIERIYVAAEKMSEEKKSIEHYWEEQKKFWDRTVDIDLAPLEKAQGKVADMLKNMRQLPKKIEQSKLKAMGKAPRMQRTPSEIAELAKKNLQNSSNMLDEQETLARTMHAKHGHLMELDLGMFDRMRKNLLKMDQKLDQTLSKVQNLTGNAEVKKGALAEKIKEQIPEKYLKEAGLDPDDLLPVKKITPWHDHGFPHVIHWRKNMENDLQIPQELTELGFTSSTIKKAWLGLNKEEYMETMTGWGEDDPEYFSMLPALAMPRFFEARLISIRLRPDIRSGEGDTLVPGSDAPPLFLPAIDQQTPLIVARDELHAWLIEQEIGDCCSVLAMTDSTEQLDETTLDMIQECPFVLVIMADSENETIKQWQAVFPELVEAIIPKGRDIYDLHQEFGLRSWLMEKLPTELARQNNVEQGLPEEGEFLKKSPMDGLAIPKFDIKAMVKSFSDELNVFHQPKVELAESKKAEAMEKAKGIILKATGKNPEINEKAEPVSASVAALSMSQKILAQKKKLKEVGQLTPEIEKKLTDATEQALAMGADGDIRYQKGMVKLAAARDKIAKVKAGEIPDDISAAFTAKGVDPNQLKKLTREEVQARYEQGVSLVGANISEVDLSELDLPGVDLSKTHCRKTIFKNCNLQGAIFEKTIGLEADFSEADLRNSTMDMAIFNKANFSKARFEASQIKQTMFKEANFTEVIADGATFHMSVLQKANLAQASFNKSVVEMSLFSDAKATGVSFKGAMLKKCLFKRTVLDKADFSDASTPSTMFHGAQGEDVSFKGADLTKGRMAGEAQFPGADFTNSILEQTSLLDSNFSGADFRGARISSSLLENCNFHETNMAGISAIKSKLKRSNFERANLAGINLYCGSLKKARLVETDLRSANLFGVDFYKCIMGNTLLDGANLKRTVLHKRTEYLK